MADFLFPNLEARGSAYVRMFFYAQSMLISYLEHDSGTGVGLSARFQKSSIVAKIDSQEWQWLWAIGAYLVLRSSSLSLQLHEISPLQRQLT